MRIKLVVLGILAAAHFTAAAQEHRLGVGLMMGEPTGPVVKYFLNQNQAIDGCIGWSFAGNNNLHMHADYLWHNYDLFRNIGDDRMPLYYGIGGRVKFGGDTRLGVRAPLGISYLLEHVPVDVFAEAGPSWILRRNFGSVIQPR